MSSLGSSSTRKSSQITFIEKHAKCPTYHIPKAVWEPNHKVQVTPLIIAGHGYTMSWGRPVPLLLIMPASSIFPLGPV